MPALRIVLCGFLAALVVTAGAAAQEPRDTVGPVEQRANAITPENPVPRRTFSPAPIYPPEASGIDASASVTLVATLDESGRVVEIRKVREPLVTVPNTGVPPSPAALRDAAAALVRYAASALRQWQYDPPAKGPISFGVTFLFRPGAEPTATQSTAAGPPPPPSPAGGQPGALSPSPAFSSAAAGAVRVGGNIRAPQRTKSAPPAYPASAQAAGVQGVVILEAVIGTDGTVKEARVLRSVPLLDQAAIDAVKQWEYTPTLLNGVPTPVIMTVTVTFTLGAGFAPPPAE